MYFNLDDLINAWNKTLKGKKIKAKIGNAVDSEAFYDFSKQLYEEVKLRKGWVRNKVIKRKDKKECCLN